MALRHSLDVLTLIGAALVPKCLLQLAQLVLPADRRPPGRKRGSQGSVAAALQLAIASVLARLVAKCLLQLGKLVLPAGQHMQRQPQGRGTACSATS